MTPFFIAVFGEGRDPPRNNTLQKAVLQILFGH